MRDERALAAVPLALCARLRERWLVRRQGRSEIAAQIELLRGQFEAMSDLTQEVHSLASQTDRILKSERESNILRPPSRLIRRIRGLLAAIVVANLFALAAVTLWLNALENTMSSANRAEDEARAMETLAFTLILESASLPPDLSSKAIASAADKLNLAAQLRSDADKSSARASSIRSTVLVQATVLAAMLGGLFSWIIAAVLEPARVWIMDIPDKRTRRFGRRGASSGDLDPPPGAV